jgi:hypothetical protein
MKSSGQAENRGISGQGASVDFYSDIDFTTE